MRATSVVEVLRAKANDLAAILPHGHETRRGLQRVIEEHAGVCIAMRAYEARNFFGSASAVYANYETLVGAGVRLPASAENDSQRRRVAGGIFGSYADRIIYAALTVGCDGLVNYGNVFVRLKPEMIRHRTTFLIENSYRCDKGVPLKGLAGLVAVWPDRSDVVFLKFAQQHSEGILDPALLKGLLVRSGASREDDDFVEAHIFGQLTHLAAAEVSLSPLKGSRAEQVDAGIAIDLWEQLQEAGK